MIIFLVKIYGKSWAILDVDFPFNRIILRAEKAIRVISFFSTSQLFMKMSTLLVSQKNLSFLTTFSKTHRQTQRKHSWIGLGLRKVQKLVPCELNTQTCMRAVNRQPCLPREGLVEPSPSRSRYPARVHARGIRTLFFTGNH